MSTIPPPKSSKPQVVLDYAHRSNPLHDRMDTELPPIRTLSTESTVSEKIAEAVDVASSTMIDIVVERFSLIENHKVRGNWRYALGFLLLAFPLITFIVMMWYQLYESCDLTSTSIDYFAKGTVRPLLYNSDIHYCGAYSYVGYVNEYGNVGYDYFLCTLKNQGYPKYSTTDQCRKATLFSNVSNVTVDCFNKKYPNFVTIIVYSHCAAPETAVVTAVQLTIYSVVVTIYLYFVARLWKKFGLFGVCSPANWESIKSNEYGGKKVDLKQVV